MKLCETEEYIVDYIVNCYSMLALAFMATALLILFFLAIVIVLFVNDEDDES